MGFKYPLALVFVFIINLGVSYCTIKRHSSIIEINQKVYCTGNIDCIGIKDATCIDNTCTCPRHQEIHQDTCVDAAPYIHSNCTFNSQCHRLHSGYECDQNSNKCICKPNWRYLKGRCWPSAEYGESCQTKEQCFHHLLPFSMDCLDGVCKCADGYYTKQKGECRRISSKLGGACILDSDCKIEGVTDAVCGQNLKCISSNLSITTKHENVPLTVGALHLRPKNFGKIKLDDDCSEDKVCEVLGEAECSLQNQCVCKAGYYPSNDKTMCLVELGMPVSAENENLCVGRTATVMDGICDCPIGFFYDSSNNRNCKKPARYFNDSCIDDSFCYTFGEAGRCVNEIGTIFKHCDCDKAISSKDERRRMCVLFDKSVGVECEPEDICPPNSECTDGFCTCIENTNPLPDNSYCIATDIELGESCVFDEQCSTNNSGCINEKCSCKEYYYRVDDECKIGINGPCDNSEDCEIENSSCSTETSTEGKFESKCMCNDGFTDENFEKCLKIANTFEDECEKSVQCWVNLGDENSVKCENNRCSCTDSHHSSSGKCWKKTALGDICSNSLQCYLPNGFVERTECRNSVCQCKYDYQAEHFPDRCNGSGSLTGWIGMMFFSMLFLKYINL